MVILSATARSQHTIVQFDNGGHGLRLFSAQEQYIEGKTVDMLGFGVVQTWYAHASCMKSPLKEARLPRPARMILGDMNVMTSVLRMLAASGADESYLDDHASIASDSVAFATPKSRRKEPEIIRIPKPHYWARDFTADLHAIAAFRRELELYSQYEVVAKRWKTVDWIIKSLQSLEQNYFTWTECGPCSNLASRDCSLVDVSQEHHEQINAYFEQLYV